MPAIGPQSANYTTTRPATDPVVAGALDTWFQDCSAPGQLDGTVVTASWLNVVTAQLREAIRLSGVTLDDTDDTMLYDAIIAIASGIFSASNGIKLVGTDFQSTLGDGTRPLLDATTVDKVNDRIDIYDASGAAHSEISAYELVRLLVTSTSGDLTITPNAGLGTIDISFTTAPLTAVVTNASLTGNGTAATPLAVVQATTTQLGGMEVATDAEVEAGVSNLVAVTPATLSTIGPTSAMADALRTTINQAEGNVYSMTAVPVNTFGDNGDSALVHDIVADTFEVWFKDSGVWVNHSIGLGASGPSFTAAAAAPAGAVVGDFWWNTTDEILFMRVNDGVGDRWLDIST